ncbi:late competence development ComFB family protein [Tepidibacter formicigenes]|uniref:Competence protein ComFB n=1 Tax=Tepidibacter formicigenes DSM 15518 TaxID=1123349 RepID=A0A1M6PWV8_9FIRM|nr:late competence development ComFB family protein [Tepidibacter formicigenes]SHK12464.1 competence protein ComFB [Tepidibacter formicigenes DSM 15518]
MYELRNYMEDIVGIYLGKVLQRYNKICKCEKCILDIKAIALNNLPPKYCVSEKGKVFTKINEMNSQFNVDIMNQLVKAVEIVSKNPHNGVE